MMLVSASGLLFLRHSSNHKKKVSKLLLCCGAGRRQWNSPVRDYSKDSSDRHSKLYELRTYSICPQYLKPFVQISTEWMHLRCNHSKMIGYWMTELGGINQAVHIWEYDSFAHRAQVRKNVGADKEWQEKIFTKILPMMSLQENSVLSLLPWSDLKTNVAPGGVYELQTFHYQGCGLTEWGKSLEDYSKARAGIISLVGAFRGNMAGNINTSIQLWHYSSPDEVDSSQSKAQQDKDINSKYSTLLNSVSGENRKIMNAQPWSVLQ